MSVPAVRAVVRRVWQVEHLVTQHNLDAWVLGTWVGMVTLFGLNLVVNDEDFPAAGFSVNFRVLPVQTWGTLYLALALAVTVSAVWRRTQLVGWLIAGVMVAAVWSVLAVLSALQDGLGPVLGPAIAWLGLVLVLYYCHRQRPAGER